MKHIKDMKQYLEKITESDTLELKESKNSLPKEFWPTYSSFSNTNGGRIILGIKEHMPQNIVTGVKSPDKVVQDLWNNLSNKQKVSFCAMNNSDINIVPFDENHSVIFVDVPEADLKNKPVHLNNLISEKGKEIIESRMRNSGLCFATAILLMILYALKKSLWKALIQFQFHLLRNEYQLAIHKIILKHSIPKAFFAE